MMMRYLDEAVETCETLLQPNEDSASPQSWTEACQTVGNILSGMGFVEESYPWRSMALDETPNAARFYAESGRVYSECKAWERALYFCQRTLEYAPDNVGVRCQIANIHNRLGNYRQESQTLNELLANQPDKATGEGHYRLGQVLSKQGQNQAAQKCYERAIAQDNRYVAAYYALGDLLAQQHQYHQAIGLLGRLIEILEAAVEMPDEQGLAPSLEQRAMAYYRLGRVYRQSRQLEPAVAQFRQALKLDSRLHWAYMGLLNTLMQMQRWDEVIEPCQKLINRADEFPWLYTFMGNAFAGKKDWSEAAIAHQKAFERRGWRQCAERGYVYGQTWFAESIPVWEEHLADLTKVSAMQSSWQTAPLRALSLGAQDEASLCWLVDKILTDPEDSLLCIAPQASESLKNNASKLEHPGKLVFAQADILQRLSDENREDYENREAQFSIILVQSDRKDADYLQRLLPQAWMRLKPTGVLLIQNYQWCHPNDPTQSSQVGIDAFISAAGNSVEVLHRSHQVILKKVSALTTTERTEQSATERHTAHKEISNV